MKTTEDAFRLWIHVEIENQKAAERSTDFTKRKSANHRIDELRAAQLVFEQFVACTESQL